jgi:hypothetical protein
MARQLAEWRPNLFSVSFFRTLSLFFSFSSMKSPSRSYCSFCLSSGLTCPRSQVPSGRRHLSLVCTASRSRSDVFAKFTHHYDVSDVLYWCDSCVYKYDSLACSCLFRFAFLRRLCLVVLSSPFSFSACQRYCFR